MILCFFFHNDFFLQPGNILVENFQDATVKICDFGKGLSLAQPFSPIPLSSLSSSSLHSSLFSPPFLGLSKISSPKLDAIRGMSQKVFGSPAYAAPELPTPEHTNKVDVFSFAVMYEIVSSVCLRTCSFSSPPSSLLVCLSPHCSVYFLSWTLPNPTPSLLVCLGTDCGNFGNVKSPGRKPITCGTFTMLYTEVSTATTQEHFFC